MVDRPAAGPSLLALRTEIEQIDRAIVVLLAARVDVAGAAIRCRSPVEGRIANPAQEARVLARARKWGSTLGLPVEVTNTVFRTLIEEGKARFAAEAERAAPDSHPRVEAKPRGRVRPAPTSTTMARPGAAATL